MRCSLSFFKYSVEQLRNIGRIYRTVQRLDGFVSANAGHDGAEIVTKPLIFSGDHLELNVDCSAGGHLNAELQTADGKPIPKFTAADCDRIYHNNIRKTVAWRGGTYHGEPSSTYRGFPRTTSVTRPSDIFVFGELHPYSICRPQFGVHMDGGNVYHIPGNQHRKTSVFAMADGHAESHKWVNSKFNNPAMAENDGRVVSNFILQALRNDDITVYGDGSQTRSFCYVDDLIDGLIRLMKSPEQVTGPINIGNPAEFTILQLANEVIDLTGSRSRITHRPKPEDDPRQRRPDISKAQDILQWSPHTPLHEGLTRTVAHFEELLRDASVRESLLTPTEA
jgi:hypothetical protein